MAAIVHTESSGSPYCGRYEPNFTYLYHPRVWAENKGITFQTEEQWQKTSWGLMQIMGATAREMSFTGQLTELCNPIIGLEYGCKYLKHLKDRWPVMEDYVAAYNAGSPRKTAGGLYVNEKYIDKVMSKYRVLSGL